MISKFNTPPMGSASSQTSGSGSSDKLMYLALALVGIYAIYRFVIKPEMEKRTKIHENDNAPSE